jgi:hypothetical protein
MPRLYTVEFEAQTVATASGDVDLFEFDAAAEKPIELFGLFLAVTSEVTTNVGEDEFVRLRIIRGHTTTGNGTSTTPRPLKQTDAAAGFVAETNGASIAAAGTGVNLHSDAFNIRTGFQFWWPEGAEPDTSGTSLLVVRMMSTLADDVTMSGTAYIRELG